MTDRRANVRFTPDSGRVERNGSCHGHSCVCYSAPDSQDKMGVDFDVTGRLSRSVFDQLGIPREADVYLCGPPRFMADMKEMLAAFGVAPGRIHVELFNGSESMTPGVVGAAPRAPHLPCRTGVCHNCESGLVWGAVAYEPQPLEKPADGNLLVCCSQPIGDVVIDL